MIEVIERKECTGLERYLLVDGALLRRDDLPELQKEVRGGEVVYSLEDQVVSGCKQLSKS